MFQIYSALNPTIWDLFPRRVRLAPIPLFVHSREGEDCIAPPPPPVSLQTLSPPKHINGRLTDPITKCPSNQAEPWHEKMVAVETDNFASYILELRYSPLQGRFLSRKCALVNLYLNRFDYSTRHWRESLPKFPHI